MRILLVRPPRMRQAITIGEFMFCEPIGLECVYAVLKREHEVRILDLMVDEVAIEEECAAWKPDVVGLTSLCLDVENVLAIARRVKKFRAGIVTLAGGTQAYLAPGSFFDEAVDHVVQYATTENLLRLAGGIRAGVVPAIDGVLSRAGGYVSTGVAGRNEYIVPDIESTARYRAYYSYFGFRPCAIMQTSQGCSRHCRFCLRWRIEGGCEKPQELGVVLEQIGRISEQNIMIFDNDFLCDGARLLEFCGLLERGGIAKKFMCYGSVNGILRNREAVARFAANGLSAVLVGYESFKPEELAQYGKKSTVGDNVEAARFLKEIKVDAWASFMMHPDWSAEDFGKFREYIRALSPEISSLTPLTPFSPLPLYEQYADRLLFKREDYGKWTFGNVSIRPSRMSLRAYYLQILLCNLYVNFYMNSTVYLVRKFGVATLVRLLGGSLRLFSRYIRLALGA